MLFTFISLQVTGDGKKGTFEFKNIMPGKYKGSVFYLNSKKKEKRKISVLVDVFIAGLVWMNVKCRFWGSPVGNSSYIQ